MKKYLPNLFSLLNLVSGSVGVFIASQGHLQTAGLCLGIGIGLDFVDGFLARILHVTSLVGKQLDSFADLITCGLLPGIIMYSLLEQATSVAYLPWIAWLIPVCTALRLARFTVAAPSTHAFTGFPAPAYATLVGTLPGITTVPSMPGVMAFLTHPYGLVLIVILFSGLLLCNIAFLALKFTTFSWRKNRLKYIFLLIATLLVVGLHTTGIALSIVVYVLLSLVAQPTLRKSDRAKQDLHA